MKTRWTTILTLVLLFFVTTSFVDSKCKRCRKPKLQIEETKIYLSSSNLTFQDNHIYALLDDNEVIEIAALYSDEAGIYVLKADMSKWPRGKCPDSYWECLNCGFCNPETQYECMYCGL